MKPSLQLALALAVTSSLISPAFAGTTPPPGKPGPALNAPPPPPMPTNRPPVLNTNLPPVCPTNRPPILGTNPPPPMPTNRPPVLNTNLPPNCPTNRPPILGTNPPPPMPTNRPPVLNTNLPPICPTNRPPIVGTNTPPPPPGTNAAVDLAAHVAALYAAVVVYDTDTDGTLNAVEQAALATALGNGAFALPGPTPPGKLSARDAADIAAWMGALYAVLAPFDADHQGQLDATEQAALAAALEANTVPLPLFAPLALGDGRPAPPPPAH